MRLQTKEDYKKEYTKCKEDPIYFISNYIKVVHPVRGLVDFNLYPFQKTIINALEGNRFNILRKFRQAGCTTIAAAYSLWLCCFKSHQTIVILSVGDTESTEVLDRIKIMYDELPGWIKPKSTTINAHNLKLENNSHIKSRPSGKQSGRGLSGSLLIIDEAAFIEHIDTIWAAVYPIISTGGRAFVLSTVNGITHSTQFR
jgi:phage terminase large subunit-like protein